jgi:hypothetical protein
MDALPLTASWVGSSATIGRLRGAIKLPPMAGPRRRRLEDAPVRSEAGRRSAAVERRFASGAGHDVEFAGQHTIQTACAPVTHGVSNER